MIFLELQTLSDGRLVRINVAHIARYGVFLDDDGYVVGSTVILSEAVAFNGSSKLSQHIMRVVEKPESIDAALSAAGVVVAKPAP